VNSNRLRTEDEDNTVGSLSETQHSIVVGSLLGDGAMRCKKNALLEINHCYEQRGYVDWKHRHLSELVGTGPKARAGNGRRIAYRFTTRSHEALTPYYRAFYASGRKAVPLITLTPLILAVWFMDDGCKSRRSVYLNTQQFDAADQARLMSMLDGQFGIRSSMNKDKSYHRLRIAVASMSLFKEIVGPHILPQFEYKLPA
jgi:recombination protein RecA